MHCTGPASLLQSNKWLKAGNAEGVSSKYKTPRWIICWTFIPVPPMTTTEGLAILIILEDSSLHHQQRLPLLAFIPISLKALQRRAELAVWDRRHLAGRDQLEPAVSGPVRRRAVCWVTCSAAESKLTNNFFTNYTLNEFFFCQFF